MLQKTSEVVAECHRRAAEFSDMARRSRDPQERQFYLEMERRWLFAAHSCDFTDRLTSMRAELDRRRG